MKTAIANSVRVFRERGYHATSLANLTEAMEVSSGSVYRAFKDKRTVFLAAFDHEATMRWEELRQLINAARSGRDRVHVTLIFCAESSHGIEGKRGCLIVGTATELATFDSDIAQRVTAVLHKQEMLLVDLIRQGQADGSIPTTIDCKATAHLMLCLLQGMRVVGKTERSRGEMRAVADAAMKLLA